MTEKEQKMYDLIKSAGEWQGTAALGLAMWPEGKNTRTPQGMALAAGKILRRLIDAGLVQYYSKPGHPQSFYRIVSSNI